MSFDEIEVEALRLSRRGDEGAEAERRLKVLLSDPELAAALVSVLWGLREQALADVETAGAADNALGAQFAAGRQAAAGDLLAQLRAWAEADWPEG